MQRKYVRKFVLLLAMALLLVLTACVEKKATKKPVAKLQSVESDEDASGGIVSADDMEKPKEEAVEEEEETLDEEDAEAVTTTTENGKKTVNLRVATYNIATGREVGFDYSVIAADIKNSGADIVALQEIDQVTLRNRSQDTMAILSAQTGMPYYAFAPALSPYQEGEYGVAILSKYPIDSYMYYEMPKVNQKEEQRVLLQATVEVGGMMLDFFVTHAQSNSITQQLAAANEYISNCSKFIYAGDFNTSNYSYYKAIANSYSIIGSANPILTTASYSFDNIILSNNIQSSNVRTINTGHSDHYMVLTDVVVPVGQ